MTKHFSFQIILWCVLGITIGWILVTGAGSAAAQPPPDLSQFDSDLYPAIDVSHASPIIAKANETVTLEFAFACGLMSDSPELRCLYDPTLYAAWGNEPFQPAEIALDEDEYFIARAQLPATDPSGHNALRYYIEVRETRTDITVRYPTEGFIELAVAPSATSIVLPAPQEVAAETVLALPWGNGEGSVAQGEGRGTVLGPEAIDVAPDGTVAVLNGVDQQVILFDPSTGQSSSFQVQVNGTADIAFGHSNITVLDLVGEQDPSSGVSIPQLHQYQLNGKAALHTPVFARFPALLDGNRVIDWNDNRVVVIVNDQNQGQSRNAQRASRSRPELLTRFLGPNAARVADPARNLLFEINSEYTLGTIELLERARDGYVIVFQGADAYRIVWFSHTGAVLQDISTPSEHYSLITPGSQVAKGQDGSIYLLNTTIDGIEILRVQAPTH